MCRRGRLWDSFCRGITCRFFIIVVLLGRWRFCVDAVLKLATFRLVVMVLGKSQIQIDRVPLRQGGRLTKLTLLVPDVSNLPADKPVGDVKEEEPSSHQRR